MTLTARGQKWLKGAHLVVAGTWVGAGACLNLMNFALTTGPEPSLHGRLLAMKFVDDFVIIPCALGTLATAVAYATLTRWGWFRHWWVVTKWVVCVGGIVFGTFWLGPWLNGLPPVAQALGGEAAADRAYLLSVSRLRLWGSVQVASLVGAVFLSALKPWGRRPALPAGPSPEETRL
ncbi:MAG: hypothetical protein ABIL09_28020 [Gemmatimonadota bacterium]